MMTDILSIHNGDIKVLTTQNRGMTPEEIADLALDKIIYVGSKSNPLIRDQAEAFRKQIRSVLIIYIKQAVVSYNTTIANRLRDAGHPELIKILD
jgi:TPP-dependent indolepyruvate ferredoxin oxidoreductase alpha subunit